MVIAVSAGCGGVGKSTVAAGLALAFAAGGQRTCVVELERGYRVLDKRFGAAEVVFDVGDVLAGREPDEAVVPVRERLDLLAGSPEADVPLTREALGRLTAELRLQYDQVILDVPREAAAQAAVEADLALLVTAPDLEAAASCRAAAERLTARERRLVVSRVPMAETDRRRMAARDLDEVVDAAGLRLIAVLPESAECAACAFRERSPATRAFTALTLRLGGHEAPLVIR